MNSLTACGDPRFLRRLPADRLDQFEDHADVVFGLWPDLTIAYVNPAWFAFASANGGAPALLESCPLGMSLPSAIASPIRPYFASHYRHCLRERVTWHHDYECSSADRYRIFHMVVVPAEHADAILVINSRRIDFSSVCDDQLPIEQRYRQADGLIRQCCDCRRFRRVESRLVWDWVPEWIHRSPPRVSHGICRTCRAFYILSGRRSIEPRDCVGLG